MAVEHCSGPWRTRAFQGLQPLGPILSSLQVAMSHGRYVKMLPVQVSINCGSSHNAFTRAPRSRGWTLCGRAGPPPEHSLESRRDGNLCFKVSWSSTRQCHTAGREQDPLGSCKWISCAFLSPASCWFQSGEASSACQRASRLVRDLHAWDGS